MGKILKTSSIPRNELEASWEKLSIEYQKETQENAVLKQKIKHLQSELERKDSLIVSFRRDLINNSYDKR